MAGVGAAAYPCRIMNAADLVRRMAAAGAPPEAIAIALEAVEQAQQIDADRRAKRAEAKRNERARRATDAAQSRDTDATVAETPSLDKESFPQTPFKEIKPNPVCETRTRGSRIPADWKPGKPLPANVKALTDQWPPGRLKREQDGFRDYWSSRTRNATMSDWDKGWWNRIRDQHDKVMRDSRNGSHRNGSSAARPSGNGMLNVILGLEADSRRAADDG